MFKPKQVLWLNEVWGKVVTERDTLDEHPHRKWQEQWTTVVYVDGRLAYRRWHSSILHAMWYHYVYIWWRYT